ncbi:MAG TPA: 16S rRNA (cytosine(1402)-N(4))-methyltransferase RsmH [Candidatus Dojkabacteria bacterium]|nr:16S rRNA (cytosine(1402)-N(4))-methyltransferase RsmH [Candidatus Dojkabacteria bacterium]
MDKIHIPVLLNETIDSLAIKEDGFYIDGTLGDGGHSFEILKRLSPKGLLISIDQDQHAIDFVKEYYKESILDNWIIVKSNFSKIDKVVKEFGKGRQPDGILLDIGLSSRQLEESHNRGFSYQEEKEPLDMRMDEGLGVTAKDLLNVLSEKELARIFWTYGEERYAQRIAKEIKKNISNINTVGDLTRLIYKAVPAAENSFTKNPSRRVFQALRIVVNDELGSLEKALDKSFEILNKNGRLSVITFHSLEDRIVKNFNLEKSRSGEGNLLFSKHIAPTDEERISNPRSASAKLRTLIKN